ncbi:MAG: substrate-binding domain-containing protein [Bacteroidota bacterium]|nr:substrate-binding domain-containing protein [Bacteroidota bacterium]
MKKSSCLSGMLILLSVLLLIGCGGRNVQTKEMDTPTSGRIRIGVDDAYKLLAEAQIYAFQSLYSYAKFDTLCRPEADVINAFMKDSIPMMIVNRELTKDEEARLNSRQLIPHTTKIAYDAVAFILNRNNPDSNLFYDNIRAIFEGKITTWKQMNSKSKLGNVKIIFDNYKSSNTRYFREKFNLSKLPGTCFAQKNNQEVIDFVEKNENAIGVVSVNWISDKQDSVSNNFLNRVRVAGISQEGTTDPDVNFYQPYQAYIAQGLYPFVRSVYCINHQTYSGLAYGLVAFIAGNQGQLIVLHSGLVPATMPVRLVQIKH